MIILIGRGCLANCWAGVSGRWKPHAIGAKRGASDFRLGDGESKIDLTTKTEKKADMDPNATLEYLRDLVADSGNEIWSPTPEAALSEIRLHFDALDEWLAKGGFLPDAWQR